MQRITKEQLIKENAKLKEQVESFDNDDYRRRKIFSKLLSYHVPHYGDQIAYSGQVDRSGPDILVWPEIFFKMGELKSDADYSMTLSNKRAADIEIQRLMEELHKKEQKDEKR